MNLSRNHASHDQQPAPWDGPFAPAPSMAPARFNPMVRTAAELVGADQAAPTSAPAVAPAAPAAA